MSARPGVLSAALITVGACANEAERAREADGAATPAAEITAAPSALEFSDASVIELLDVVNAGEIDEAELARGKTQNEEVRRLAQMMILDHQQMAAATRNLGEATSAAKAAGSADSASRPGRAPSPYGATLPAVTPGPTTVSPPEQATPAIQATSPAVMMQQLQQESERVRVKLLELSGLALDQAYMDRQVRAHEQVLDLLDHRLLPNAQDARLRQVLQRARATLYTHLAEARRLQQVVSGSRQSK